MDPDFFTLLLCAVFQSCKHAVIQVSFGLRADVARSELTDGSRQRRVLMKNTNKGDAGSCGPVFVFRDVQSRSQGVGSIDKPHGSVQYRYIVIFGGSMRPLNCAFLEIVKVF